jgi:hypothetical protein
MTLRDVLLSDINFADETFRITEDLDLERMSASLQAAGQLNPVVLLEGAGHAGFRIVCGFRRLHALLSLGRMEAAARIVTRDASGILQIFLVAVWDNLAHRQYGPLEAARILHTLKHCCGVKNEDLVARYLPSLGLSAHGNVLHSYLRLHRLNPDLRRLLNAGHLTLSSAERLARIPAEAQAGLAPLLGRIRLSASLQREVLELAEDIAALAETDLNEVLNRPGILAIADAAGLSAFQRGDKIHRLLYEQRNPRLSAARAGFLDEKSRLNLPGTIRLAADPFFETPRLRVEFDVTTAREFREVVGALERACGAPSLERLFEFRGQVP